MILAFFMMEKEKKNKKDVISFSNAGANGGSNCVFQLNEASR